MKVVPLALSALVASSFSSAIFGTNTKKGPSCVTAFTIPNVIGARPTALRISGSSAQDEDNTFPNIEGSPAPESLRSGSQASPPSPSPRPPRAQHRGYYSRYDSAAYTSTSLPSSGSIPADAAPSSSHAPIINGMRASDRYSNSVSPYTSPSVEHMAMKEGRGRAGPKVSRAARVVPGNNAPAADPQTDPQTDPREDQMQPQDAATATNAGNVGSTNRPGGAAEGTALPSAQPLSSIISRRSAQPSVQNPAFVPVVNGMAVDDRYHNSFSCNDVVVAPGVSGAGGVGIGGGRGKQGEGGEGEGGDGRDARRTQRQEWAAFANGAGGSGFSAHVRPVPSPQVGRRPRILGKTAPPEDSSASAMDDAAGDSAVGDTAEEAPAAEDISIPTSMSVPDPAPGRSGRPKIIGKSPPAPAAAVASVGNPFFSMPTTESVDAEEKAGEDVAAASQESRNLEASVAPSVEASQNAVDEDPNAKSSGSSGSQHIPYINGSRPDLVDPEGNVFTCAVGGGPRPKVIPRYSRAASRIPRMPAPTNGADLGVAPTNGGSAAESSVPSSSSSYAAPTSGAVINGASVDDRYHNSFSCNDNVVPPPRAAPRISRARSTTRVLTPTGPDPSDPTATSEAAVKKPAQTIPKNTDAAAASPPAQQPPPRTVTRPNSVTINGASVDDRYHNTFSCNDNVVPPPRTAPRAARANPAIAAPAPKTSFGAPPPVASEMPPSTTNSPVPPVQKGMEASKEQPQQATAKVSPHQPVINGASMDGRYHNTFNCNDRVV